MKKFITILIVVFAFNQLSAQNYQGYYYAGGKPVYWQDDSTSVNIIVRNMEHYDIIVRNTKLLYTFALDDNSNNNIK
jgi:hypothetical protein